jgi:adenine/guanine phosphoribosyltransferase-like PRPP-binding protein
MCYFDHATQKTQITVDTICHELQNPKLGKVDLIVGTGFSGTLLLAAIYLQSGIPFGAIRKDINNTHSGRDVETGGIESLKEVQRYVIIDDFIESGETISNIKVKMSGHECIGIIFYQNMEELESREGIYDGIPYVCLEHDVKETARMEKQWKS